MIVGLKKSFAETVTKVLIKLRVLLGFVSTPMVSLGVVNYNINLGL